MSSKLEYHNAWGASASYFTVKNKKKGVPLVIFLPENKSYWEAVKNELIFFSDVPVFEYPSYTQSPFEEARPLPDIMSRRSNTLYSIQHEKDFILLISPYGALKTVPDKSDFNDTLLKLSCSSSVLRDELLERLDKMGYVQVEYVTDSGEYTFRGGIADIFPTGSEYPLRIEFFDDEIERIFYYDNNTQLKKQEVTDAVILPVTDFLISTKDFISGLKDEELKERAESFGKVAGYHWLAPFMSKSSSTIFDYLSDFDTVCYSSSLEGMLYDYYEIVKANLPDNNQDIYIQNFVKAGSLYDRLLKHNLCIITEVTDSVESSALNFSSTSTLFSFEKRNIYQSMTNAVNEILSLLKKEMKIIFCVESEKFLNIFKEFLRDYEIYPLELSSFSSVDKSGVYIYRKRITGGFVDKENHTVMLSDMDIFGFTKRKPRAKKTEVFNTQLSDLEEGDYVVHVNHGIGIYRGIKHMVIAGTEGDFLDILYDGDDILYVPLHSINQIQKYIGLQDHKPKLNSLKSSAWQKLKKHAKESAKTIAEDLLRLYAERKAKKGYAFNDDGSFVEMFERSFEYSETEDQLSAIYDVYKDMESETPMERLVCGDVGFGKTEVAMRGACKAAACGKQVAVLVPTTILARQHYETFKERFKGMPVKVDYVSRFRSNKDIKAIYEQVADGSIDILIGTHKILSKNIEFKDLGLLIIDEEQRFGVNHKEKISAMKRNVDTLTLTATPIPRTLQLSLSGIRDMSVIETPPENRLPVIVKVIKGMEERVKAIRYELERGGQVFFLHNRVQDISEVVLQIKMALPHVRVDYAHGQMEPKVMEDILSSFYNGEIDVLVATTIIENGINIPNVNTMIINNAAHFGLAQLYQLKGRVGRSDRRGYCYLSVENFSSLNPIAQKRLSIIQQLSDLGSGFKIAMYDLQLRGAGNILGAEQSGFVVRVGYELYVAMIEEAVQEMRGEFSSLTETEINSNISYFIPADYIENPRIRFDFYRRFAGIYDIESMEKLLEEISLSYGEIRQEVKNLGSIMLIKNLAGRLGAVKLNLSNTGSAKIIFMKETKLDPSIIMKCADRHKLYYRFLSEYELLLSTNGQLFLRELATFFADMLEYFSEQEV